MRFGTKRWLSKIKLSDYICYSDEAYIEKKTQEQISYNMQRVKNKNTDIEHNQRE